MLCCLYGLVKQRPWRFGLALPTQISHDHHMLLGKERCWRHSTRKRMASAYVWLADRQRVATCSWGLLCVFHQKMNRSFFRWTTRYNIINQSIIVKNAWQLVAARCNSRQFCRANAFNCVTESRRRATRQTCGIDSGFGFNIYDYQTSYWQYNALESAVSNDNLWFFENYLEGISYLLTLTKVWPDFFVYLIHNAEMITILPRKHWLYFTKQALRMGINHNQATQLSLVSCAETHISSTH